MIKASVMVEILFGRSFLFFSGALQRHVLLAVKHRGRFVPQPKVL